MVGSTRSTLPVERIKIVTEAMGYQLEENLLDKVQACASWFRRKHAPKPKGAPPSESVN